VQAEAADDFLHVDVVAAVHPGGDEVASRPGVAGVVAHPVGIPALVWVGECLGESRVWESLPAVGGDSGEGLVLNISRVVAPV